MNGCYQVVEVAYKHHEPLTQPSTLEGASAAWRLVVDYLKRQPGWLLIERVESVTAIYATFKTDTHELYGVWVMDALGDVQTLEPKLLHIPHKWIVRSVPIEAVNDYTVDVDKTPSDAVVDMWTDRYCTQEAGV
jgi:hypothetical protein